MWRCLQKFLFFSIRAKYEGKEFVFLIFLKKIFVESGTQNPELSYRLRTPVHLACIFDFYQLANVPLFSSRLFVLFMRVLAVRNALLRKNKSHSANSERADWAIFKRIVENNKQRME